MKNLILTLAIAVMVYGLNAQVAINNDNSPSDNSTILDIKSTSKGVLMPRMTALERNSIANPAKGLMVYCIDNDQYYVNKGTPASPNWVMLASQWITQPNGSDISYTSGFVGIGTGQPHHSLQVAGRISAAYGTSFNPTYVFDSGLENTGFSSPAGYTIAFINNGQESARINWNGDFGLGTQNPQYRMDVMGDINTSGHLRQNGVAVVSSQWSTLGSDILYQSGSVGIGTPQPHSSAALEVSSVTNDKGFLPPRMNYQQRNALPNPAEGLVVFCTDCNTDGTGTLCLYRAGKWRNLTWNCPTPAAPVAAPTNQLTTTLFWNWEYVPNALGYKWSQNNQYESATDLGSATSYTEQGLQCATSYRRYVWAYNECGHSPSTILTGMTTRQGTFGPAPTPGIPQVTATWIQWQWNCVPGAIGYYWNSVNDTSTAVETGSSHYSSYCYQTWPQTPLNCNTTYKSYVWAHDACGLSPATELTATTEALGETPEFTYAKAAPDRIEWHWECNQSNHIKWNTVNDYSTATDLGNVWTKTETGLQCNTTYTRYIWSFNDCGHSPAVAMTQTTPSQTDKPIARTQENALTQITWKWKKTAGALGYKWNYNDNYATATNVGTDTSHVETGLIPGECYSAWVWAYSICSVSEPLIMTSQTSTCGQPITVNHVAGAVAPETRSITYRTFIDNINGFFAGRPEEYRCWIDRNLGAREHPMWFDKQTSDFQGWYWQFNRKQGFIAAGTSTTPAWTINSINENSDWLPENDPCRSELGCAWRIPTKSEWETILSRNFYQQNAWQQFWFRIFKLYPAGKIEASGTPPSWNEGSATGAGFYWSTNSYNANLVNVPDFAWMLSLMPNTQGLIGMPKATGASVKCFMDSSLP
jgi:hypothetical protein